ncbi:MAG TPA: glycosyltransferase [Candidatus Saccharimonadales bacterium]|nr:glycosyltransferase [Candidatus Saccharimonadales bacterium]
MKLALILFAAATVWELLLWTSFAWPRRKWLASPLVPGLAVTSELLFASHPSGWTALVALFTIYRIVNLLRLIEGRTQNDYLFQTTRKTALWLLGLQLLMGAGGLANHQLQLSTASWWYLLAAAQILAALVLALSTRRHLRTTGAPGNAKAFADKDLPSLTVAIPARNETDDLEACLKSLVASDYPKLEIIVLDDCSQVKRTPEIIREFAHDGVRFLAGKVPPERWLAKNYAYQQLSEAASGKLLLFCGVDVRFEATSLRAMVETLLTKKKAMISFIPRNILPGRWTIEQLLVQASRYAWELSLPRRLFQRPPVLSTSWLITAEALHAAGGFKAVASSSSIESYFAQQLIRQNDGYSFLQSSPVIGLTSAKSFEEQRFTALRLRYPQLHRRPELVGLVSLLELASLLLPFAQTIGFVVTRQWLLAGFSALTAALLISFYSRVMALTYRHFLIRGLWLLPFAAMYDVGLLNYSMVQYEFGEVLWKGRNVCIPVMRVFSSLPKG